MIGFKLTPDDGETFEVTAKSRDVYLWEKTSKGKSFKQLMDSMSMVDLYAIAHLAAKRTGQFDGTLDEFSKTVDLDFETEDEPDPTPAAPGAAS